jgi:glyoxylase-like metal-dependent hydrolase (beta-lactamase superfamily II)
MIIDPGDDDRQIKRLLDSKGWQPAFIVHTHGHIDHIGADNKFSIPIYIHRNDFNLLKDPKLNLSQMLGESFAINSKINILEDKQDIRLREGICLKVIHTPGHTAGSICLLLQQPKEKVLFSGDTLFFEGVGRTDFPGACEELLFRSIKEKLFSLDDDTVVYPGHGQITSIGHEKQANPFLISR